MEKIKEFLNDLIKAEETAHTEYRKEDNIEVYNEAVDDLDSYTFLVSKDHSDVSFNLIKMDKPHDDDFFEELPLMEDIVPREIYKISHYQNERYGDLWACYLSVANAYMGVKRIHECFIVVQIDGELKIIASFAQDMDQPKKWRCYGGDRGLKIKELGKLLEIERLLEPIDDVWSMEEYAKDI